jgi:putative ATP-dependent endonuclease of the OLD family
MRITRIVIENYRSIRQVDINPSRFSVFVGQNNHGKTNLFEAIEWFYTAKSSDEAEHFDQATTNTISVELFFDDVVEGDIEKLTSDANKTKIRTMLGGETSFCVLKTSTDHKRRYVVGGADKGNPAGIDAAINEFVPKLEYVSTRIRLDDVAKFKEKNPIGAMLSGVLTAIVEVSPEYRDFREKFATLFDADDSQVRVELNRLGSAVELYLRKQFPDGTKVKFTVNPPQFGDLLKSFDTTVDDGIVTRAEDKGDGMQRAIMLSIIQAFADYRKAQLGGGSFLFLIDEAELHLHPSAQRALKHALLDISTTDQVLVNTHSSVLVVEDHELQKIFKVEKEHRVTRVEEVDTLGKADIVFDLLGGSPSDLLLPRNFLIVEGRSEYEFLRIIIRRFYPDRYRGIKILFAGGDLSEQEPTLLAVHKLFSPLAGSENPLYKDRAVVLIDKPNAEQQTKYTQFKAGYPYLFENNQVFELPVSSLEEYYPAQHTKTTDEAKALGAKGEKVAYAREVAETITEEQFSDSMPVFFHALERCAELAFAGT